MRQANVPCFFVAFYHSKKRARKQNTPCPFRREPNFPPEQPRESARGSQPSRTPVAPEDMGSFNVRGGLAIYGGVLAGWIFTRAKHIPFLTMADVAAPALALGQAVGRWGNFVNQEAYGVPVTTPALQWFPLAVYIEREGGWFAATFFYESAWCFLICALILILERTRLFARPGRATLFYVFMYAAERTVVEGLRMDSLYLGSVRVSQALSALLLLAAALLLCLRLPRRRKGLLIPTLAAIPLFFLSPFAYALLLLAVCLACYVIPPAGGEPPIRT